MYGKNQYIKSSSSGSHFGKNEDNVKRKPADSLPKFSAVTLVFKLIVLHYNPATTTKQVVSSNIVVIDI